MHMLVPFMHKNVCEEIKVILGLLHFTENALHSPTGVYLCLLKVTVSCIRSKQKHLNDASYGLQATAVPVKSDFQGSIEPRYCGLRAVECGNMLWYAQQDIHTVSMNRACPPMFHGHTDYQGSNTQ